MNLPLAPIAAAILGVGAALGVVVMPGAVLESLVMDSGLPSVISAAEPPLGMTARLALAAGAGGFVALLGWFTLFLLFGTRGISVGEANAAEIAAGPTPVIRRADAHPDARPRAPLLATRDLGTPFLDVRAPAMSEAALPISQPEPEPEMPVEMPEVRESVAQSAFAAMPVAEPPATPAPPVAPELIVLPAEQLLPDDLYQTLAAFDPGAIRDAPAPLPEAVTPLRRPARPAVFDESERFEIFELTPAARPLHRIPPEPRAQEEAIAAPETDATIHALLERLEKGVVRRGHATADPSPRQVERGLEDALVTLRNLARRA